MNDLTIFETMKKINCNEKIIAQKNSSTVTITILKNCVVVYSSVKNEAKKYTLSSLENIKKTLKNQGFIFNTYKI
jgi:hypothetical protein